MITDAKNDFKDPAIEDIDLEISAYKIEVSEDGSRVFYGGEGLGELQRGSDLWLHDRGIAKSLGKAQKTELKNKPFFSYFYFEDITRRTNYCG